MIKIKKLVYQTNAGERNVDAAIEVAKEYVKNNCDKKGDYLIEPLRNVGEWNTFYGCKIYEITTVDIENK